MILTPLLWIQSDAAVSPTYACVQKEGRADMWLVDPIVSPINVEMGVSIRVSQLVLTNDTPGNITFGPRGHWGRISDLKVRVENSTGVVVIPDPVTAGSWSFSDKPTFYLGSNIMVFARPVRGGESVCLVTSRAVLFNGRLREGMDE